MLSKHHTFCLILVARRIFDHNNTIESNDANSKLLIVHCC